MDFSYDELSNYSDIVNAVDAHASDVKYYMQGAFPDSSAVFDIDLALSNARLLVGNAEALLNELTALRASRQGVTA